MKKPKLEVQYIKENSSKSNVRTFGIFKKIEIKDKDCLCTYCKHMEYVKNRCKKLNIKLFHKGLHTTCDCFYPHINIIYHRKEEILKEKYNFKEMQK